MDDYSEILLKSHCCMCLSTDRKLYQLCRIVGGINNLYSLLSYDSEAYRDGFYTNTAKLFICWECKWMLHRFTKFREQACLAQKQLSTIVDRQDKKIAKTLSKLSVYIKKTFDITYSACNENTCIDTDTDNFIDCGPSEVKSEPDDLDDVPLSQLHKEYASDNSDACLETFKNHLHKTLNEDSEIKSKKVDIKKVKENKKAIKVKNKNGCKDKKYFTSVELTEDDMMESREHRKLAVSYADAVYKCESCIEGFKYKADFDDHNTALHSEKENHDLCDICLVYIQSDSLMEHRKSHYLKHNCNLCDYVTYTLEDMMKHFRKAHAIQKLSAPISRKKGQRNTPEVLNPGSKPRRNPAMLDKRTPFGYLCAECNKYFDNKNQRWKHIQRHHREGFKCATCGKRFAFKNNLTRHEQMHGSPPPYRPCSVCHKPVRADLAATHARVHAPRSTRHCQLCDKRFVSRASYEHHLNYTRAHATVDILKYKCDRCDKGYRSRGELRDHINYQHMGKTLHKCPVCNKALATRRCITRHVRRAHHGIKESARDKICQQCGKAFRDKKGLREHELIHTGERPLSCEICGLTFRQSASLYTHRRRVHRIAPSKKVVQLVEDTS